MAEIKIKALYEDEEKFYPQTHIQAVIGLETIGTVSSSEGTESHSLGSIFYKYINENVIREESES